MLPGEKIPWWKTRNTKIAGISVLSAFIAGFFIWFSFIRPYISTDDARIDADIINIANNGSSGQILSVNVKEGDFVTNGMTVVELDHQIAQAQYRQAEARCELARANFQRAVILYRKADYTRQQYDQASSDAEAAEAVLKVAEIALERTYIRSITNGCVIMKNALAGNILEANQVAITIADIDHAWVSANIDEKSVALIKPGQSVYITIDEGGTLKGHVSDIRKASESTFSLIPSDNATGNYIKVTQRIPLKIDLESHPGINLKVGESVEIKINVL
ncbi:MAG: efflux RND transporter periplasmic adaptor subunit [Brevinematales bacterium]|jgi:membrane fusion protein (multidrug efflux system)